MQHTYFSIIVDESTDITSKKVLCVVVRDYDENVGHIRDAFFDLIELDASNASSIKTAIVKRLDQFNIPYKKFMLGIGSDNVAVMVGQRHSVTILLRDDCPHLVSVPCICHSLASCASYASKKLHDHLEQMLKDIYSYLSASPVRLLQFDKIHCMLDFNPIRVPRMHDVRFLSRGQVVKAVLSRYEPLQIYFGLASNVDNLSNASKIHKTLADPVTEIYLLFLDFILPFVDNMNKLFQSEKPEIISLHATLSRKLRQLLSYFIKDDVTRSTNLTDIKFHLHDFKPVHDVYLGVKVATKLDASKIEKNTIVSYTKYVHCVLPRVSLANV
ncbi:uncharacterized protein LOC129720192 [Wyeomyia smithii]|uniref:uncharacterized protein LOC129720192 n=1 Tax=Wyeomyia smithii TaxID=174621 RepID=UPI002467E4C0|nr:uncharacterized protein LOC129720192 [Wyeomyia smithii]